MPLDATISTTAFVAHRMRSSSVGRLSSLECSRLDDDDEEEEEDEAAWPVISQAK